MSLILEIQRRIAAAKARAAAAADALEDEDPVIDPEDVPAEFREEPETGEVTAAGPADIAELCVANGCPALAAPLIRQKATMEEVKARIDSVSTIRAMVADAGTITESITADMAEEFIKSGLSVEQVRTKLWAEILAVQSPEINSAISAETGADTERSRAARGMDEAINRVNARLAEQYQVAQGGEG